MGKSSQSLKIALINRRDLFNIMSSLVLGDFVCVYHISRLRRSICLCKVLFGVINTLGKLENVLKLIMVRLALLNISLKF